jgi:hypothetical protein
MVRKSLIAIKGSRSDSEASKEDDEQDFSFSVSALPFDVMQWCCCCVVLLCCVVLCCVVLCCVVL